jgi:UDP-N-acetylmuramoylalanine--D-glutamate ligase
MESMDKRNHRQRVSQGKVLVVGMGKTGLSCVRFLQAQGLDVLACDNRDQPPLLAEVQQLLPAAAIQTGAFDAELFSGCRQLVVSPGVPLQENAIQAALQHGVEVIGDIELFARHARAPVIAITGSNGKSTVTALVGELLQQLGCDVRVGGNYGTPALDLLAGPAADAYVLELSSFQLETTFSLQAAASVILNVSPDHMDRYADVTAYLAAKQRIWAGDGVVVVNRDEPGLLSGLAADRRQVGFTLAEPVADDYGLRRHDGQDWLAQGEQLLLPVSALRLVGRHNYANALAALALVEALLAKLPAFDVVEVRPRLLQALSQFHGLPHRMEWLATANGVNWYNDSKGTNVGATLAALQGLEGPVVLIAGGLGKDADFTPLSAVLAAKGRAVVLIGRDAALIESSLNGVVPCLHAVDMEQAVALAATQAQPGDVVLLSPACASFDMFDGYEHRGRVFADTVRRALS